MTERNILDIIRVLAKIPNMFRISASLVTPWYHICCLFLFLKNCTRWRRHIRNYRDIVIVTTRDIRSTSYHVIPSLLFIHYTFTSPGYRPPNPAVSSLPAVLQAIKVNDAITSSLSLRVEPISIF